MDVNQVPFEVGRFFVASRSRTDITHLVDLAWREEPWRKPIPFCSCEQSMAKGKLCDHIIEATIFEAKRLGIQINLVK